ncbi:MAG: phosphatase [Bacteroidetes bacterium]|nr:phosphatase [Bacteroidota bacterium]
MELGGTFCRPFAEFEERLANIKAYLFDWDGVFNNGVKAESGGSPFSEVDAMGTNMLRFGHWLRTGELPAVAIITGEENPVASYLAKREHFHALYFKSTNKLIAFDHFLKSNNLKEDEVAFVYDDVLDLGVARRCGLRLMVYHAAAPLFQGYAMKNDLADYITAHDDHGVREVCELLLGVQEKYDDAIRLRSEFGADYSRYLEVRKQVQTQVYITRENAVTVAQ